MAFAVLLKRVPEVFQRDVFLLKLKYSPQLPDHIPEIFECLTEPAVAAS